MSNSLQEIVNADRHNSSAEVRNEEIHQSFSPELVEIYNENPNSHAEMLQQSYGLKQF